MAVERPRNIETTLTGFAAAIGGATIAVLDFETDDVRPHVAVHAGLGAYLPESHRVFYVNIGHTHIEPKVPLHHPADLAIVLRPFLLRRRNRVVMHNAGYDLRMLFKLGLEVRCRV